MSRVVILRLPGMSPIPVTAETVASLERALQEYRRAEAHRRDLAAEITEFLLANPSASTLQIARGISARDTEVRRVLNGNAVFEPARYARELDGRGKRWRLAASAAEPVPARGTGSSEGRPTA